MNTTSEHQDILKMLRASMRPVGDFPIQHYLGTTHRVYSVAVPVLRKMALSWLNKHQDVSPNDLTLLVDKLFLGESREEKVLASMILGHFPKHLVVLNQRTINRWLSQLSGWEEVDSFCDELAILLLADLPHRLPILKKWAGHRQVEKRRASLVVLCTAVRMSDNQKLADLSFDLISRLKDEKGAMITKAISWLLRSLLKFHRTRVVEFLKKEKGSLPVIALRETIKKIETGKK